jgi:anti-sigma regulatory factor (Ser/Thr protein kinase)
VDLARWGLAVYEAGTNVVRHAYAGRPDGELRLIIEFGSRSITFRLLDDGSPNPNWPPAEVGYEPGERGNGLFIIREAMDRVDYLRAADGNELCLVANLPGAGVDDAEESLKRDCP